MISTRGRFLRRRVNSDLSWCYPWPSAQVFFAQCPACLAAVPSRVQLVVRRLARWSGRPLTLSPPMPCTRLLVAQGGVKVELVVSGPAADRIGDALMGLCFSPVPSWIAVAQELVRARAEDAEMHSAAAADEGAAGAAPGAATTEAAPVVAVEAVEASSVLPPLLTAAALEDLTLAERAALEDPRAATPVREAVGELTGVSASELALEPPAQRPRLRSPGRRVPRDELSLGEAAGPEATRGPDWEPLAAAEQLGMDVMTTLLVGRPTLAAPTSTLVMPRRGRGVGALVWDFETELEAQSFRAGVLSAVARLGLSPASRRTRSSLEPANAPADEEAESWRARRTPATAAT